MQCMEIWGGNRRVTTHVAMAGIDVWVYSRPFRDSTRSSDLTNGESGGDIHYLSACATGRITRMIVADVSGHGAAVAAVASSLRRLMHKFSNYIDQSRFVEAVNQRFNQLREESAAAEGLFATAVVASYFAPTDELTICNAGHPRPLLFDSRAQTWHSLDVVASRTTPANLPLGVLDDVPYDTRALTLAPDDLVVIFTDPLIELRDARAHGRLNGEAGLVEILNTIHNPRAETLIKELLDKAAAYTNAPRSPEDGEPELNDDVTILVLRRNQSKPKPSIKLSLMGAVRVIANAVRSVFARDVPLSLPEPRVDAIFGSLADRFNRPGTPHPPSPPAIANDR